MAAPLIGEYSHKAPTHQSVDRVCSALCCLYRTAETWHVHSDVRSQSDNVPRNSISNSGCTLGSNVGYRVIKAPYRITTKSY